MNKKIKNATPNKVGDIEFKSLLESRVYKTLISEGLNPQYEPTKFILWEGFKPTIPFFAKSRKQYKQVTTALRDITYTPDFILNYGDKKIFIEVKGFQNDSFPIKFKMFRKLLEGLPNKDKIIIWEVFSLKQLKDLIKQLKDEKS